MPHYNVLRPSDGKWAMFSTIVDDYIKPFTSREEHEAWRIKRYGEGNATPIEESNVMTYDEAEKKRMLARVDAEWRTLTEDGKQINWTETAGKLERYLFDLFYESGDQNYYKAADTICALNTRIDWLECQVESLDHQLELRKGITNRDQPVMPTVHHFALCVDDRFDWRCPACDARRHTTTMSRYCSCCGQRLDWDAALERRDKNEWEESV